MPRLAQFYGIAVYMYYRDHAPPHFHALYGEDEAVFAIADGSVLDGKLPRRARQLVETWAELRRDELAEAWRLAVANQPLPKIAPLD